VEQLKRKLFEIGVIAPYMLADALAGAFEEAVNDIDIVKKSRANNHKSENTKEDKDTIDVEFEVIK
jgi:hypothetical protein